MFGKKKIMLEAETVRLTYRVRELEERLYPCEQHQWLVTDMESVYEPDAYDINDETTYYTYKCRRCGKTKRTWELLRVCDGSDGNG